ncbi:hypothetical protein FCIRC_1038 [Fusarium circinatum]|uniref:Uncharacterized protein n=1 Tax=Fusarium circinatum TaxID=48490 RepID=A0A8H5UI75_FUSCI|nr:hypothetical protein FCIRC_1038 [Fusarium circinatum]
MVAPSWSWLAFSGSVESGLTHYGHGPKIPMANPNSFYSFEYQPLALLSQAVLIPLESDPFISFERAILKIRCLLLPTTFAGTPRSDKLSYFFRQDCDVKLHSEGLDCFRLQACDQFGGQGQEEYTRVGSWEEDYRFSSQLSPSISNTIIKLGVGKKSILRDGSLTKNERVFDSELRKYAKRHVASKVQFPMPVVKRAMPHQPNTEEVEKEAGVSGSEAIEQEANEADEDEGPFFSDNCSGTNS